MRKRLMMTILAGLMGVISPVGAQAAQSAIATITVAASGTNGLVCSTDFGSGPFLVQGWSFGGHRS